MSPRGLFFGCFELVQKGLRQRCAKGSAPAGMSTGTDTGPVRAGPGVAPDQFSSFAFIVIFAFSTFDTGQPALALLAISWNFAGSAPGIFTVTSR